MLKKITDSLSIVVLKNAIAISCFFAIAGWNWDGWWHVALGRDSFFSPPHITQYTYLFTLFFAAILLYKKTKEKTYRYVVYSEFITLFSGVLDIIWHQTFGKESVISPLIIWSPPHIVAFLSTGAGMFLLMRLWIRDYQKNRGGADSWSFLRIVFVSSGTFYLLHVLIFPLEPLGWHYVAGFGGLAVTMFFSSLFVLYLAETFPKSGIITVNIIMLILFFGFEATHTAPGLSLPPHAKPPQWLHFFAVVPSLLWIDYIDIKRYKRWLVGGTAGFLVYAIYIVGWRFVQTSDFPYSQGEALTLVFVSTLGGILAGALIDVFSLRESKKLNSEN